MAYKLTRVDGLAAVPPSSAKSLPNDVREVVDAELATFREAGWRFVATPDRTGTDTPPTASPALPAANADAPEPSRRRGSPRPPDAASDDIAAIPLRAVYRDAAGNLVIDGASIAVKFSPALDAAHVDAFLATNGLQIRRRLGFVPNAYEVTVAEPGPSTSLVDLAEVLEHEADVEYAEPQTVEKISHR